MALLPKLTVPDGECVGVTLAPGVRVNMMLGVVGAPLANVRIVTVSVAFNGNEEEFGGLVSSVVMPVVSVRVVKSVFRNCSSRS